MMPSSPLNPKGCFTLFVRVASLKSHIIHLRECNEPIKEESHTEARSEVDVFHCRVKRAKQNKRTNEAAEEQLREDPEHVGRGVEIRYALSGYELANELRLKLTQVHLHQVIFLIWLFTEQTQKKSMLNRIIAPYHGYFFSFVCP